MLRFETLNTSVAAGHLLLVAARGAQNGNSSHICLAKVDKLHHIYNTSLIRCFHFRGARFWWEL